MAISAVVALGLEFVAYRPLRKRNSPPLIALISAIGASFVLSEAMGLRDKPFKWFGADDNLTEYVGRPREASPFPLNVEIKRLFYIFDYHVSNIDLIVLGSAHRHDDRARPVRAAGPGSVEASAPWRRTPSPPPSWASTATGSSASPSSSAAPWPAPRR